MSDFDFYTAWMSVGIPSNLVDILKRTGYNLGCRAMIRILHEWVEDADVDFVITLMQKAAR